MYNSLKISVLVYMYNSLKISVLVYMNSEKYLEIKISDHKTITNLQNMVSNKPVVLQAAVTAEKWTNAGFFCLPGIVTTNKRSEEVS